MEIKVPSVGESVFEALIGKWLKPDGAAVKKDEPLCEIETDKITFELNADAAGRLSILVPAGTTVKIGTLIGAIDERASEALASPAVLSSLPKKAAGHTSPLERKKAREKSESGERGAGTGKESIEEPPLVVKSEEPSEYKPAEEGRVTRVPMTPIRRRIAERLLAARQQTAMLTSFNEADMGRIVELRQKHREYFLKKHGVSLGFMSFFVRACCEALKEFPMVNARIDGDDIVYQHFYDIGIAVSGEKGLVVPVLRDADRLHFAEIEQQITGFVEKIKTNKLAIADLEGGTFTISNGGVFGSLLSTPIINPPQTAVLGMHAVQDRPVAKDGKVIIRPMMYLALSYDHRLIDGREAVQFLKRVKEFVEEPEELFLEA